MIKFMRHAIPKGITVFISVEIHRLDFSWMDSWGEFPTAVPLQAGACREIAGFAMKCALLMQCSSVGEVVEFGGVGGGVVGWILPWRGP